MSSHLFLTLDNNVGHELSEPLTDLTIDSTEDEYHQPMDKEPTDTDVEETLAQPKKKKVKVRDAIKAIGREEMIHGEGVKKRNPFDDSETVGGNCEAGHGTNNQVCFPFIVINYYAYTWSFNSLLFYTSQES